MWVDCNGVRCWLEEEQIRHLLAHGGTVKEWQNIPNAFAQAVGMNTTSTASKEAPAKRKGWPKGRPRGKRK